MLRMFKSLSIRWKLQIGFMLVTVITTIFNRLLASEELSKMVAIAKEHDVNAEVIALLEQNHQAYIFNSFWESGIEFVIQFIVIGIVATIFVRPILRLRDPRRFGAVLWLKGDPLEHKLLVSLGPEPLSEAFDAEYLFKCSRKRKQAVKLFVMDSHTVVGVGNIYASEALFRAGIRPQLAAGKLTRQRCMALVEAIKVVLNAAIRQGGTTLRDFVDGGGKPGYFKQKLQVYGRGGEPCRQCDATIKLLRQGQRASYYCPACQR